MKHLLRNTPWIIKSPELRDWCRSNQRHWESFRSLALRQRPAASQITLMKRSGLLALMTQVTAFFDTQIILSVNPFTKGTV